MHACMHDLPCMHAWSSMQIKLLYDTWAIYIAYKHTHMQLYIVITVIPVTFAAGQMWIVS